MATNSPEDHVSARALERDGWTYKGYIVYRKIKRFVKGKDVIIYDKETKTIIGRYQLTEDWK